MSHENRDDAIYRSCLIWDVPAIKRSEDPDAILFLKTLQLNPHAFSEDVAAPRTRMSPMRRAAFGLRAELSGDTEMALEHYKMVARLPGVRGLLGQLLIAWTADATPKDFKRVENRLGQLTGPGTKDLVARTHCRLAGWALDRGWPEAARHHFELARRSAGKQLRFRLYEIGHWVGLDRRIYFKTAPGPMIQFPWILDFADDAARKSVEERFKESFKNPWTRTWTWGGTTSVEGLNIQSAEMQASWAGALWLMPTLQRLHAALILNASDEPEDVTRAIALWVRGGGKNAKQLVEAYEGHLTGDAVMDLMINRLHAGGSVTDRSIWLETCDALWSELPASLVDDIVNEYEGPPLALKEHSDAASELSLFAKLLLRSAAPAEKVANFDDVQIAHLLRVATFELLKKLDQDSLRRGLTAAVMDDDNEWATNAWRLAYAWTLLPSDDREELREPLTAKIADWQIALAAATAEDLFSMETLESQLDHEIAAARADVANAAKGMFAGSSVEPGARIAWLVYRLGTVSEPALGALLALATDRRVDPVSRQAALRSLTSLAREGLLDQASVAEAFQNVESISFASRTDDPASDQRYEDLQRVALRLSFGHDSDFDGHLLAGSRDPNTRVRYLAVETAAWVSLHAPGSPPIDGALLGALYDPDPSVHAAAIPALWRGEFVSLVLREAAQRRVMELWPSAPLRLREAIALEAKESVGIHDEQLGSLAELCRRDRSVLVRWAIAEAPD